MGLTGLVQRLRAGELSPREAVETYLARIEAQRDLNAYITVRAEEALAEAALLESAAAPRGPLHGAPVAVKDVIDVAGTRTTAGSAILARPRRGAGRRRGRAAAHVRRDPAREAQHARVRLRCADDEPALRRRRATRGRASTSAAGRAAGRAPPRPPTSRPARSAPTPAARSGSRRASAASPACARRSGSSRTTASSRPPGRSTPSGRSRAAPRTARCCSTRSPARRPTSPAASKGCGSASSRRSSTVPSRPSPRRSRRRSASLPHWARGSSPSRCPGSRTRERSSS